uniref:Stimulated by retinoic acid 8 n=1 Tax=Pelusios castaneus TaxID=367368 RepID=A0A8C8SXD3_9SAUR
KWFNIPSMTSYCSSPYVRVTSGFLTHLQDLEPHVVRRRLSQARHRATLAGLFNNLRETVYSQSDNSASKVWRRDLICLWIYICKESFSLEDGNPSSLEEVKEEYGFVYSGLKCFQCLPSSCYRYLYFYKQTVDLLVENGIVCTEEVTLPVVSTAVSHLWQDLPEERRDSVLQYWSQRQNLLPDPKAACPEVVFPEGSARNSTANSQEVSESLVSMPEEILFEDAFDVAAGFLDRNETQATASPGSVFTGCSTENPEDNHRLYLQITGFLKSLFFANTQFPQVGFTKVLVIDEGMELKEQWKHLDYMEGKYF